MARLLIVDDKEQDRYLLRILLKSSGYAVEEATDGAEGLRLARANPPDMVVSDILMPVMDGFSFCREWRRDERLRSLPFVFYSATYTDPRDEELAISSGADAFLVKPLEPVVLLERLKEVLSRGPSQSAKDKPAGGDAEDQVYFKQYSQALVRKLEDKLELFRTIFHTDPSSILLLSPTYTILELNRAAMELLGVRAEEVIDTLFVDRFVAPEDRSSFAGWLRQSLAGVPTRDVESRIRIVDGSEHILRWNAHRLSRASGSVEGVLVFGHDITRQREAEEQRKALETQLRRAQRMEAIGAFAGGIAHDFNNVLTGILGFVDLTRQMLPPDSEILANLDGALEAADRARKLVAQILSISRRTEESSRPVELEPIVKEVGRLLRASIPARVKIDTKIEPVDGSVVADPTQVHQVLMNLCTNAFHAIGDNDGAITISCRAHRDDCPQPGFLSGPLTGEYAVIEVADTGSGMSDSTMEKMFEPYFTTKEKGEGTGLGLAVVKAIVELHRGRIGWETELRKGSKFRVYLPLVHGDTTVERCGGADVDWRAGANESVLVVEDDVSNGPMIVSALAKLGYRPALARDGREALSMLRPDPRAFVLVLTDLNMPNMGGVELAREIMALSPDVPVVLMSGSADPLTEKYMRTIGVIAYLQKPFGLEPLARCVRDALGCKHQ